MAVIRDWQLLSGVEQQLRLANIAAALAERACQDLPPGRQDVVYNQILKGLRVQTAAITKPLPVPKA